MLARIEKLAMVVAIVLGAGLGLFAIAVALVDQGLNPWVLIR